MNKIADDCAFVGLDYHSSSIQDCVVSERGGLLGTRSVPNDGEAVRDCVDRFAGGREIRGVAIEACCGASKFAEELMRFGWQDISLAHPGSCSRMKQNPDKSDLSDARLLAELMRAGFLPRVWLPPSAIRDLRRLVRFRTQLIEQRRDVKLRIRAIVREERINAPTDAGNAWTKPWLAWLRKSSAFDPHTRWVLDQHLKSLDRVVAEVREVEERMQAVTKDDTIVQRLIRQKGVGLVTAMMLRAEVGSFERFRCGKQLARYCAVTPLNASSGKRQVQLGLINAGNLSLRGMLIEMAHRLCRYSPAWRAMKDRMLKRGKRRGVIAAAVANRWVRKLFWQLQQPESTEGASLESAEEMTDTLSDEPSRIEYFDEFNQSGLSATA